MPLTYFGISHAYIVTTADRKLGVKIIQYTTKMGTSSVEEIILGKPVNVLRYLCILRECLSSIEIA